MSSLIKMLIGLCGLVVLLALILLALWWSPEDLSRPQESSTTNTLAACAPSENAIEIFHGRKTTSTRQFQIASRQWRYVYQAELNTVLPNTGVTVQIHPLDREGNPIARYSETSDTVRGQYSNSSLNLDGPGTFSLSIVISGSTISNIVTGGTPLTYTVVVCELRS